MRQIFQNVPEISNELKRLLAEAQEPDEKTLREQRISFAYGNAMNNPNITKESVRYAANHIRLRCLANIKNT